MPDKVIGFIADNTADTHLLNAASSGGARTTLNSRDTMLTQAIFSRRLEVITQVVTAASFTQRTATTAQKTLSGIVPEGAVIAGMTVAVGTGFTGDTTALLTVGTPTIARRYHGAAINIFGTFATTAQSAYEGSQIQAHPPSAPVLTLTTTANVATTIAGAGSLTIALYFEPGTQQWCCDTAQAITHTQYFPKKVGTCVVSPLGQITKLTHAQSELVAKQLDYFFEVQSFVLHLTPVVTLTAASKYVFIDLVSSFTLVPYAAMYDITKQVKVVDGYTQGFPLSLPHYVISAEDFEWISKGFDAMDFAQTTIRNNFVIGSTG